MSGVGLFRKLGVDRKSLKRRINVVLFKALSVGPKSLKRKKRFTWFCSVCLELATRAYRGE